MHRIVRSSPEITKVPPSGRKGYITLRYSPRGWVVTESPFKEVPVYNDMATAIISGTDGEYVIEIDLPATDS